MAVLLSLVLMALAVKEDHAELRAGCAVDSSVVATLPAGASLTIRFALAGGSTPCYKVASEIGGRTVEGYLPAGAIAGLEEFEKGRREAPWLETAQVMSAIHTSEPLPSLAGQVMNLIDTSQPAKALALLESEI